MYVNFNLRFECVNTKPKNCDIILEKQKCKYLMNKLCQNKKKKVTDLLNMIHSFQLSG